VLSKSERTKWQEIYQKFEDYQFLTSKQRKLLVENTQFFLDKLKKTYSTAYELNNLDSTLTRITQEILDIILANTRQCVSKIKTQAEQKLNILQKQQQKLYGNPNNDITQGQILETQSPVKKASQDANFQLIKVFNILEKLNKQPRIPAQLHNLTQQYLATQSNISELHQ
jgi:predicted house-cleaning noncanonical NTP pyrophosphatase (MazG superfamily)